jgi:hypothetical protein
MDWLEDYLDYTEAQESPTVFHYWCGVATIASVLNRRVWMPRIAPTGVQYYVNYPGQLSPMLIAGAGKAKKSTAINIAKSFMKEAGVRIFDGKITPERLLAKLASLPGGQAIMTVVASELSAFLGKQSYNDGLIDALIKLADCESHPYETQKKTFDLSDTNICLTLLSGSTPVGLSKAIPPQAQEHGFLSRYIWVYSEKSGKAEALANDEIDIDTTLLRLSTSKRRSLAVRLRAFTQLSGRYRWGKSREWFIDYYKKFQASPASEGEGWPTRRTDHLVRLAVVLNVSRGCDTLELSENDLVLAEKAIIAVEREMPKCFAYIGQHINAEKQEKIIKLFREKKVLLGSEIHYRLVKTFGNLGEIAAQMSLMQQAGILGYLGKDPTTKEPMWTMLKEPY